MYCSINFEKWSWNWAKLWLYEFDKFKFIAVTAINVKTASINYPENQFINPPK